MPHLRQVRVGADGSGVGIQRVVVLVDFVVEHTDRAPERRVLAISVHSLLVRFVGLAIVTPSHIRAAQKIPGERIRCICWDAKTFGNKH